MATDKETNWSALLRCLLSHGLADVMGAAVSQQCGALRITRQTTILALLKEYSCARSTVLLTMNLSFDSSQNGGVVCRDVPQPFARE